MRELHRRLDELTPYCDLQDRLRFVPPSAKLLGLYFRSIEAVLEGAGKLPAYRTLFPEPHSAVRWYPVEAFLVRLAVGGSLLTSPERVHEGMYEIGRRNAVAVSESLVGRTLLRLLSPDPKRLLEQGMAARRQTHPTGRWTVSFGERDAVVTVENEHVYIESYLLGAARGTFEAIGRDAEITCELESRFAGRIHIRW